MNRLIVETSTSQASVALFSGTDLLAEENFPGGRGPISPLFSVLERLLKLVRKIDEIIVGVGPGSYSGIRIGISAVIGMQLARNLQALGINSALGYQGNDFQVILDARGTWIYSEVRGGKLVSGPDHCTFQELDARKTGSQIYSPDRNVMEATTFPRASVLGQRVVTGMVVAELPLLPLYLKPPHITTAKSPPKM